MLNHDEGDGRGSACECSDQNGDERVDLRDIPEISCAIHDPSLATLWCDANNAPLIELLSEPMGAVTLEREAESIAGRSMHVNAVGLCGSCAI